MENSICCVWIINVYKVNNKKDDTCLIWFLLERTHPCLGNDILVLFIGINHMLCFQFNWADYLNLSYGQAL